MLTFTSVSKSFSRVRAVNELSFTVNPGEIFALLGPNGAGKTTSVRMIMQILEPDKGSIHFEKQLLDGTSPDRKLMGYLPEERGLYLDIPVIRNLLYLAGLRGMSEGEARSKASTWLERFGLLDRQNDKVSALSKGNQQKIQFIAAILHQPKFAILDEPFSGFDPINQEMISDCIRELRDQGTTILLSAHQMQLVERISDRILMLNRGETLLHGTMDEIRKQMVSDQKLLVSFDGTADTEKLKASPAIRTFNTLEDGSLEVFLSGDATAEHPDLSPALAALSSAGSIISLKTSELSLHEIFIQSFPQTTDSQK